ncbi:hypothetical protein GpartN1_g332.t1 [Galdieria partita]|uniref:Uncharacterized protein n=1 Tax=Galdieria partita TaxID=83374 RepID=A0A9C7PQG2_9RHOD|nr:hypothetical protein GpartN1_g332.t1 [Galdieria partita]
MRSGNEACLRYLFIINVDTSCTVSKRNKYFSSLSRKWKISTFHNPLQLDVGTWRGKSPKYLLMTQSLNDRCMRRCGRFLQDTLLRQSVTLCRRMLTLVSVCTVLFARPLYISAEANLMRSLSLVAPRETCIQKCSSNKSHRKEVVTMATVVQPVFRAQGNAQKSLDFNTLLALSFLTFIALMRLCFLVVKYFQQRRKEQQMQRENEAATERLSTLADDKDAIENFRRRMNEFSVGDDEEEDELESEEEELRNGRRRSIDGRRISGGWRKGGMGTKYPTSSSSSSIVFERPDQSNSPKEEPGSGVSPEQIEMLKRMYGGDINIDDDEKDKKNPK